MAQKDPTAVAQKWANAMSGATQAWQSGVEAVTVAPGQKAAASAALWATNTAAAQQKFATKSAAVSLQMWQQQTVAKGASRLATGAQAAQPKMQTAMTKLLPYIQQQVNSLPPRGNLAQNIARATQMMQGMAKYSAGGG